MLWIERQAHFRYFATAVIYAQTVKQYFNRSKYFDTIETDESEEDMKFVAKLQELNNSSRVNIKFLNIVAGDINEGLMKYSCMQFGN